MIRVMASLKDRKALKDLEKCGELVFVSSLTDVVGLEVTEEGLEQIRRMEGVESVRRSEKGFVLGRH